MQNLALRASPKRDMSIFSVAPRSVVKPTLEGRQIRGDREMTVESASSQWGMIDVEPLDSTQITGRTVDSPTLEVDRQKYNWHASSEISSNVPEDYRVSLNVMSREGDGRRFYPDDPHLFVLNASLGGLAILTALENLDAEHRNTYNLMRLVFQYGPLVREGLDRTFTRAVDLLVIGGIKDELNCRDALTESFGLA